MKVYTVINSNAEGYNLLGIFDTLEGATKAVEKYNKEGKEELRECFKDETEEETKSQLEFFDWWEGARVVEHEMNRMLR